MEEKRDESTVCVQNVEIEIEQAKPTRHLTVKTTCIAVVCVNLAEC